MITGATITTPTITDAHDHGADDHGDHDLGGGDHYHHAEVSPVAAHERHDFAGDDHAVHPVVDDHGHAVEAPDGHGDSHARDDHIHPVLGYNEFNPPPPPPTADDHGHALPDHGQTDGHDPDDHPPEPPMKIKTVFG